MSGLSEAEGGLEENLSKTHGPPALTQDAVFGEITEEGPNYQNGGRLGTMALIMKTQFGLGVLAILWILNTLGLVPGVVCLCAIASVSTWANYVIGTFKVRHPEVYGINDAASLMFGRIGRELFGAGVYWIFATGSGLLSTSIGLDAISSHGTCTAVFVAVAAIVSFALASIRTLGKIKWTAWVGLGCILVAVFMVTIAVGVQNRPPTAPNDSIWVSDYKLFSIPSFSEAIPAISSIVYAYAGTPGFFPIASEMRDPSLYTRPLLISHGAVTANYITVGVVIYYYCGSYVASPALGSAGTLIKKIPYGISFPGLVVSTIITLHFASKYIFLRLLGGSEHVTANSFKHWATWLGCTFVITASSYLIASGIPIFSNLISLIGALLGTALSFQPMGCMWLYDNWKSGRERPTVRWTLRTSWSIVVILSGCFLMVAGTYGSIVNIIASSKTPSNASAWSCVDNSNS
ncbi:amino acid transporter [Aspergillus arachidicola]|uniref:Amino acid transporter n=1 Tax=Aspergillus arachidicola TaxID=656916 RepID=A0A2G7FQC4_9EURO|nr:amino acid transporter [Aspergillus arachidicola]